MNNLVIHLERSYRSPYRSLRWLLTGDALRKQGRFQAAKRAYYRVNIFVMLDVDRGWSMDTILSRGRVATMLGDVAIAQLHYGRVLTAPKPLCVLASGFAQSAVAYYRLGRLALDGPCDQSELKLPAIVANFGELVLSSQRIFLLLTHFSAVQAATMAHRAGVLKLHQNVLRTLAVVSHNSGIPDSLSAALLHASFFCQFEDQIKEHDRHLNDFAPTEIQVLLKVLTDSANSGTVVSIAARASQDWLHPDEFKPTWVLMTTSISPCGHIVACRSTRTSQVIYCQRVAAHWPAAIRSSMLRLTREKMQQAMKPVDSKGLCYQNITIEARREWWKSRHILEVELAGLLHDLGSNIDDSARLFSPRLISRQRPPAHEDDSARSGIFEHTMGSSYVKPKAYISLGTEISRETEALIMISTAQRRVSGLTVTQLRDQLGKFGLSQTGKKAELVARLSAVLVNLGTVHIGQIPQQARHVSVGPVILVLDATLQIFPIEVLAGLGVIPTSRIPHIGLISSLRQYSVASEQKAHGIQTKSCTYIIDPTRDLHKTRKTMAQKLEHHPWEWSGLKGIVPPQEFVTKALEHSDILLFCGHGDGRSYLPWDRISKVSLTLNGTVSGIPEHDHYLTTIAQSVLLMGCASGTLRSDTLLRTLLFECGCRHVVATLWDVTDRDIDRLSLDMLFRWTRSSAVSIKELLAVARHTCKLPLLNGAAVVCYGLP